MLANKIVVHFKDKTLLKGTTTDFFPNRSAKFHLQTSEGKMVEVEVEQAKAIFFVRSFDGQKDRNDRYDSTLSGVGRKIRVLFADQEEITGYTQGYSPDRAGFFIVPAAPQANNERIFIVKSSCKEVTFL
jgi:hypothetical protein